VRRIILEPRPCFIHHNSPVARDVLEEFDPVWGIVLEAGEATEDEVDGFLRRQLVNIL
jgi:hypothetical protein